MEGRRKLKSDVVIVLRFELLLSDVVCVELRREGDVELDLLRLILFCMGVSKALPLRSNHKSSILDQLDFKGIRDNASSWFRTFNRPFCLRVGLGLGFKGLGKAPGGNTAASGPISKVERCNLGMEVRYGSVIKGKASQLLVGGRDNVSNPGVKMEEERLLIS